MINIPEIAERNPSQNKISVEQAMLDQSYKRCNMKIYGQQILMIAPEIMVQKFGMAMLFKRISNDYLVILTLSDIIHIQKDRLLTLPPIEFKNDPKWS